METFTRGTWNNGDGEIPDTDAVKFDTLRNVHTVMRIIVLNTSNTF